MMIAIALLHTDSSYNGLKVKEVEKSFTSQKIHYGTACRPKAIIETPRFSLTYTNKLYIIITILKIV